MNIAIDATPVLYGGRAVKRHSKNLMEALFHLNAAHDYTVFYSDWRHRQSSEVSFLQAHGVRECRIPIPARLLIQLWQYLTVPKAEWMVGDIDILYAPDLYFPPSRKALVLSTIRGIAYHMIENHLEPNVVSSLQRALHYTLKHADYLLAVSQTTKDELVERFRIPKDRIFVVQHGVDPSFQRLPDRSALDSRLATKFGMTDPYILYVGVLGHHKNIMGILQAYRMIRERGVSLPLVLAGPVGSASKDAREWVTNNGLDRCVYFLGHIDQGRGDLTDLYNGASLFVFPSFYEGWTAPPLEAMACGVPVITSNCSSLPETVGEAAIQIDPHNTEELACQMERVLGDESLRQKYIRKGFEHVALHTWENAGRKLLNVFEDIHQRGPWRRRGR